MAGKRRATTELNRDNWDREDEPEEVGEFEKAGDDILKRRVIKTAKRRVTTTADAEGGTKSIFSGFGGFTATPNNPKSFSFLSNVKSIDSADGPESKKPAFSFLSNNKTTNNESGDAPAKPAPSFSSTNKSTDFTDASESKKPALSFLSNNKTTNNESGDAPAKPALSFLSTNKSTGFTDDSKSKKPALSFLSNNKTINNKSGDARAKPPFSFLSNSKPNTSNFTSDKKFDSSSPAKSGIHPKLPFSVNDKPDDKELTNSAGQSKLNELSKQLKKNDEKATGAGDIDEKNPDEVFLQKLRSLNLLCAEWIIKHLNENLGYILTPVFDDYKKHLEQLKEERRSENETSVKKAKIEKSAPVIPETPTVSAPFKAPDFKQSLSKINFGTSFFAKPAEKDSEPQFNFGSTENKTFEFGKTKSEPETTKPMFSFGGTSAQPEIKSESKTEDTKPFAFGFGTQLKNPLFGANSNNPLLPPASNSNDKPSEATEDNDDQPPVKEDVNITEEGSVYDKKCKVFIKKDGNFVDHGVGFLFLKLVGDEKKCQLIVRANNKLANVIINVLLSSSIPLEKKGQNNVMVVCCPTPEAKPSVVLLKVKTQTDADELLEMMNKHKK